MSNNSVLIIDDEDKLRQLLARLISLEGFAVTEAATGAIGLKKLEKNPVNVVLCDVKLPDDNGVELTAKIKKLYPTTEVILLTAYGNITDGVKAIKAGAFDYITKGDDNDKIIPLLHRAVEKINLQHRVKELEKKLVKHFEFDHITGNSPAILQAINLAKKVATTDSTVLLQGETGTGKEVFAQAIHYAGVRQNKNFVAVNCAALGKDILESELFGYLAGAFTGAVKDKKGLFEEADKGTIFLDEIGEMSLELQSKLLRLLETKTFIKVGGTKPTSADVRIIAASNRNLGDDADKGLFRSDLFYRLAVFQINLPPLRERKEDIEALAMHFVAVSAQKMNKALPTINTALMTRLKNYNWKGNIRELKNCVERLMILNEGKELNLNDLPFEILNAISHSPHPHNYELAEVEREHINRVLAYTHGNKTEAARLLNIGLTTLYRKLEEYKIA